MGRPPVPRGARARAPADRGPRRHPLGGTELPRPAGSADGLEPRRADPGDLHGAPRSARRPPRMGRRKAARDDGRPGAALGRRVEHAGGELPGRAARSTTRVRRRIEDAAGGQPALRRGDAARCSWTTACYAREGERWVATGDLDEVAVPPTIQALLAARLDRLDDAERHAARPRVDRRPLLLPGRASRDLTPETGARRRRAPGAATAAPRPDPARRIRRRRRGGVPLPSRPAPRRGLSDAAEGDAGRASTSGSQTWLDDRPALADLDEFVGYHLEQAHALRLELGPEDEEAKSLAGRAADRLSAAGKRARDRGDFRASENLFRRAAETARTERPVASSRPVGDAWSLTWDVTTTRKPSRCSKKRSLSRRAPGIGVPRSRPPSARRTHGRLLRPRAAHLGSRRCSTA